MKITTYSLPVCTFTRRGFVFRVCIVIKIIFPSSQTFLESIFFVGAAPSSVMGTAAFQLAFVIAVLTEGHEEIV